MTVMMAALWIVSISGSVCSPSPLSCRRGGGACGGGVGVRIDSQGPCIGGTREPGGSKASVGEIDRRWRETKEGRRFFYKKGNGSKDRQQQRGAIGGYDAASFPNRVQGEQYQSKKVGHEDQECGEA